MTPEDELHCNFFFSRTIDNSLCAPFMQNFAFIFLQIFFLVRTVINGKKKERVHFVSDTDASSDQRAWAANERMSNIFSQKDGVFVHLVEQKEKEKEKNN